MGNPVMWFEVQSKDPDQAQRFYAELFGWNVDADNEMGYGMVMDNTEGIGGGIGGDGGGPGGVMWYVQVPDPEAALQKAEELGGTRLMGPMDVPGGPTIAHFQDPDGNRVGLMQG